MNDQIQLIEQGSLVYASILRILKDGEISGGQLAYDLSIINSSVKNKIFVPSSDFSKLQMLLGFWNCCSKTQSISPGELSFYDFTHEFSTDLITQKLELTDYSSLTDESFKDSDQTKFSYEK